jgi:hypothetical protein
VSSEPVGKLTQDPFTALDRAGIPSGTDRPLQP